MHWNANSGFLLTLSRPWHSWADSVHTKHLDERLATNALADIAVMVVKMASKPLA
jgi:hypothetical protein